MRVTITSVTTTESGYTITYTQGARRGALDIPQGTPGQEHLRRDAQVEISGEAGRRLEIRQPSRTAFAAVAGVRCA